MPRHPRILQHTKLVANVIAHVLEIHDSGIIVILAWEERATEVCWMHVGERVRLSIPSTKAEIQPANAGVMVVYDHQLK